ncbi:family 43 glycosylhydrolase [Bacteroides clarus]|uniref:family 43 glycosylhydrolase n=1 Tax=Bacteroides clarus TaxID=626929 RepID=UPI0002E958F1|nr:family 43 glycosylhydrolase [Bacteroides clarus]SHH25265.1 Glycosyl hydrolases family 43 [Bacteroides clarus YIT 12056]
MQTISTFTGVIKQNQEFNINEMKKVFSLLCIMTLSIGAWAQNTFVCAGNNANIELSKSINGGVTSVTYGSTETALVTLVSKDVDGQKDNVLFNSNYLQKERVILIDGKCYPGIFFRRQGEGILTIEKSKEVSKITMYAYKAATDNRPMYVKIWKNNHARHEIGTFNSFGGKLVSIDITSQDAIRLSGSAVFALKVEYKNNNKPAVAKIMHALDGDFTPLQSDIDWAMQFRATSGAGHAVVGDGRGGWRSGVIDVQYQGQDIRPEYTVVSKVCSGTAVEEGLVPPIKPAWDVHLRDGVVTLGGDGMYYLTGSSGDNIWAYAKGIELWKSADLKSWEYMGLVWDIDKEADEWVKQWRKHPRRAVRAVWAPEIHYIRGNYFICFSMCPRGIGILKSATGKPEGPYVNAFKSNEPIVAAIDATLFEDEDGEVYFTYAGATRIARLNKEMDGFAEDFRTVIFSTPDTIASHHATGCVKRNFADIGHEGAVIFKYNGKYYLGGADTYEGRYSPCVAVSESIYGPYTMRHEAIPCGGGTGFFKDKKGDWWCSYFGNDTQTHFREKVGFVRVSFSKDGHVYPALDQPFVPKSERKTWEEKWERVWKNKYN